MSEIERVDVETAGREAAERAVREGLSGQAVLTAWHQARKGARAYNAALRAALNQNDD